MEDPACSKEQAPFPGLKNTETPPKRSIKKELLLFLASLIFAVILGEILAGVFTDVDDHRRQELWLAKQTEPIRLYTRISKPDKDLELNKPFNITYDKNKPRRYFGHPIRFSTDDKGYIVGSRQKERTETREKIIFTGGSTTKCISTREDLRFPSLTGEILEDKYGLKFDTLNYGVGGHTTQDSINLLLNLHRYQKPAYLVIMHNVNDRSYIANNMNYMFYAPEKNPGYYMHAMIGWIKNRSNWAFLIMGFLENTGIYRWHRPRDHKPPPEIARELDLKKEQVGTVEAQEDFKTQFRKNLIILIGICRVHDITPVLMTQPLGYHDPGQDFFNQVIRNVSISQKVHLIDLDRLMTQDQRRRFFQEDKMHYTDEASLWIADVIAKRLSEIINEDKARESLEQG